jgi:hypothetical protein
MGGKMTTPAAGIWWSLANLSCALLDAHEREVVRGDLAESGVSGGRAFREVAGLVMRRQAAAWLDWRPWFMLVAVVLPIGVLLSHASRWWGVTTAVNVATYWSLWDFAYLGNPGWRRDLMRVVASVSVTWLALIGWSWTSGFILGRLSRKALWSTLALFAALVFAGTIGSVSTAQRHATTSPLQYHVLTLVVPGLLRIFLVMLPVILGALRGARKTALPLTPIAVGVLLLVVLTSMASRGLEGSVVFGRGTFPADPGPDGYVGSADDPRPLWPLSFIMLWPAAYILTSSTWQRWRHRHMLA